jgi:Mn2+/Fe2+ NRAMP family transporter
MGIYLTLIVGLVVWIVLWGTSLMKSFDAFLIGMLLVLLAATFHIVARYLPGSKD